MTEHILFAYSLDGNGGGTPVPVAEISKHMQGEAPVWIHVEARNPDTRTWLENEIPDLDPLIIQALLAEGTRPRLAQIDEGILLILRGVNLNENASPEDMISIRLWVDKHRIITARTGYLKTVRDIEGRLKNGKGPKDPGEFICMLTARLFERMEPVLSDLNELTDNLEEKVLDDADASLREAIIDVRMKAIIFRRYMAPQRDTINQLHIAEIDWFNDDHRRHLWESYNHVSRYIEDLDAIRERSQIVKDELSNILTDKLNRNMYILSVIAAVFLPLGFLTGLLGINVGGIPGADNPYAFWVFSALLGTIVILQVLIFKRLKWF